VYDITDNPDQIDEAAWAVSEIHADLEHVEKQKMFILISSVMTWARSKPLDPVSTFDLEEKLFLMYNLTKTINFFALSSIAIRNAV